MTANIFCERTKQPGTLRGEGSSRAQCSPQSQPATPKQHLRGRKANFETSADTKKRTCPEPGEFRDLLREMTHPDDSVGASSKPLLSWRPRVAKSRSASLNDIHHQVTVSSSSSMIDATHPQVVRLSSPPRIDVLVGAIVICGLSLVGFSVFLLRRHIHSQLNQAARRVCVRSNTTACTRRSSRLSTGTACPSCAQRAVVVLQAFARGRLARAHACRRAKAAVRLQSKYRCWALALAYCRLKVCSGSDTCSWVCRAGSPCLSARASRHSSAGTLARLAQTSELSPPSASGGFTARSRARCFDPPEHHRTRFGDHVPPIALARLASTGELPSSPACGGMAARCRA